MKKLAGANSTKAFDEVGKKSAEKANVVVLKNIADEDLIDYPANNEDLLDTADLENSIEEVGFTDPIEVTSFNQPEGKFMIVSGHRRRVAGRNKGVKFFPSIVKSFNDENELQNYVLLANAHRDSSKDPLLYCKRYKLHEEYLKSINFKGSIISEVAKRLGVSSSQAERYKSMSKVISPVWDMVRDDVVGMSSVTPLAILPLSEQELVLEIFNQYLANGIDLTRPVVKKIIDEFKDGKRTYDEIFTESELAQDKINNTSEFLKDRQDYDLPEQTYDYSENSSPAATKTKAAAEDDFDFYDDDSKSKEKKSKSCPHCGLDL